MLMVGQRLIQQRTESYLQRDVFKVIGSRQLNDIAVQDLIVVVKTVQRELSPLANKFSVYLGREKVAVTVKNTALLRAEKGSLKRGNNRPTENRPHVEDTRLGGAVLNPSEGVGVRTPNDDSQQGGKVDYSNGHFLTIKEGERSWQSSCSIRTINLPRVTWKGSANRLIEISHLMNQ